jgi:hypothetical protein
VNSGRRHQRASRGEPQSRLSRCTVRKSPFNIALKRDLDPDAGVGELYPQEITRALLNFISNGFHAVTMRKATT